MLACYNKKWIWLTITLLTERCQRVDTKNQPERKATSLHWQTQAALPLYNNFLYHVTTILLGCVFCFFLFFFLASISDNNDGRRAQKNTHKSRESPKTEKNVVCFSLYKARVSEKAPSTVERLCTFAEKFLVSEFNVRGSKECAQCTGGDFLAVRTNLHRDRYFGKI